MSLADNVAALATRAAQEIKAVRGEIAALPGGGGAQQVFVQPAAPVVAPGTPHLWFQTGLGAGDDMTLWVEDGL